MAKRSRFHVLGESKFWLVIVTMLLTFATSGVIYGWTGMRLVLTKEGVYSKYSAGERSEKFDLIITIASFFTAGSGLFIGLILDAVGPRVTAALSSAITIGGCFVFGWKIDLTVGYAMFAVGGMGILISAFRAAYLYPGQQSLVIGSISCLFDSSTVIFVIFDVLYESYGVTLKQLCVGYAAITLVLQLALFTLWTMNPKYDRLTAKAKAPDNGNDDDADKRPLLDVTDIHMSANGGTPPDSELIVADRPFSRQIRSVEFIFIYIFCCVQMFRSNMFLGTAGNFLLSLGDAQDNDYYSKFLASIIPLGFIFVPVISYFLDRRGFAQSGYMVVVIGAIYGGLSCVQNLKLQLATAFFFTFYRAALFSFVAAYNAKIFGPASVGRVTGILYTSTAVLITLQYPATTLTVDVFNNNYLPMHALLTGLCLAMAPAVAVLQCKSHEVGVPLLIESDDEDEEGGAVENGASGAARGRSGPKYGATNGPTTPQSHASRMSGLSASSSRSRRRRAGIVRSFSMGSEQSFIDAAEAESDAAVAARQAVQNDRQTRRQADFNDAERTNTNFSLPRRTQDV